MADKPAAGLYIEMRAMLAKLQQDMNGAVGILTGAEKKITSSFKTLEKVAQAALVVGGVLAVKKLSDALNNLAAAGDKAGDIADGFRKLGGSAQSLDAAKKATLGLVDSFELMRLANEGLVKNIPGFNENFGKIADLGARLAQTLGTDTTTAINDVTQALATGKAKGLQALGFVIDAEAAYDDFAKAIGTTGDALTSAQQKEAIQRQAMQQLVEVTQRLAPVTDDVTTAHTAFQNALGEAYKQVGIAINENDELRKAWRELEKAVQSVDWEQIGRDIGDLASIVLNFAATAIPAIQQFFHEFVLGAKVLGNFKTIYGTGLYSLAESLQQAQQMVAKDEFYKKALGNLNNVNEGIQNIGKSLGSVKNLDQLEVMGKKLQELSQAAQQVPASNPIHKQITALGDEFNRLAETLPATTEAVIQHGEKGSKALKLEADAAKGVADSVDSMKKKFEEAQNSFNSDQLKQKLEQAVKTLNSADFGTLKQQLEKETYDGFVKGFEDAIKAGAVASSAVDELGKKVATEAGAEYQKEFDGRTKEVADEQKDKFEEAYSQSIDTWRGLFENAITGTTFDLESALKQVAVGFAAELANAVFGSLGGINISSPQDLGGAIFQNLLGSIFSSGQQAATGGLLESIGLGSGASAGAGGGLLGGLIGSFGGGAGVMLADGSIVAAGSSAASAGVASAAMPGTGMLGALGPWGAAAAGLALIGSQTSWFGLEGGAPTHPETVARREFTGALEEIADKLNGIKFFDESGNAKSVSDFKYDVFNNFNKPGWADSFNAQPNSGLFNGVGMALGSVMGNSDLPLGQVGAMLFESVGGSVEGLKAVLQATGKSAQEFGDALMQAGKDGKATWVEVIGAIHSVDEAMKPGLTAVGAFNEAFTNLLNTGARGQISLNQLKNVAVEAQEAGITSLQALQDQLMASGKFKAEDVQALFNAMNTMGIKSLQDLAGASDRVLAEIIANMQAQGVQFEDSFAPLNETINKLEGLPDTIEKNVVFNVTANMSDTAKEVSANIEAAKGLAFFEGGKAMRFARGGVVSRPTYFGHSGGLGMMGEAGPEGILPLKRINGKLGVSTDGWSGGQSVQFNIDARGASPGMENKIRSVMNEIVDRATRGAIESIMQANRRGGRYGASF